MRGGAPQVGCRAGLPGRYWNGDEVMHTEQRNTTLHAVGDRRLLLRLTRSAAPAAVAAKAAARSIVDSAGRQRAHPGARHLTAESAVP